MFLLLQPTDAAKVVSHPITGEIQVGEFFLKNHHYTIFFGCFFSPHWSIEIANTVRTFPVLYVHVTHTGRIQYYGTIS